MHVTFLIGNGFDLNLGLPTDYVHFLKYHQEKGQQDMISKAIREDYKVWSDMEAALGAFTKNVTSEDIDNFLESKCLLDESLSDYLECINDSFALYADDKAAFEFRDKLRSISSEFSEENRLHYESTVQSAGEAIKYCFITFNYTNYLDSIIEEGRKLSPFVARSVHGSTYSDTLLKPIHVHGKLGENVLLGVNDNSQLEAADEIKLEIGSLLVKPYMNAALGERRTEKAKDLINSSLYVFIYGMSLGATDSMWWEFLAGWLKNNAHRRLVLYVYSPTVNRRSGSRTISFQNKMKNEFLKAAKFTDSEICKQIIIVPNTKLFTFEHFMIDCKQADEREEAV